VNTLTIELPWLDMRLSPNARNAKHWSKSHGPAKADRSLACGITASRLSWRDKQAWRASRGKIRLSVTFNPPDNRKRDDDGLVGAFKHRRDGIADALGIDDNRFAAEYQTGPVVKGGAVFVLLHLTGEPQ
jgi:crossover junction endodeoxyribonuclease RusA